MLCYFLGDSITDCGHLWEPENLGDGYVRLLQEEFENNKQHLMVNKGQDGFTAKMVLDRFGTNKIVPAPDVITILIGINDVSEYMQQCGSTPEQFYQDLKQLVEMAGKYTKHIVLMEPFLVPWPQEFLTWMPALSCYQEQVRKVAQQQECLFVPLQQIFAEAYNDGRYEKWTIDGTHPSKAGHQLIADAWKETVAEHIKL